MKRALLGLLLVVGVLVAVLVGRSLAFSSRQVAPEPLPAVAVDATQVAARLAGALRLRTVSAAGGPEDESAFLALHDYLAATFPLAHEALTREVVGGLSLLYTWEGSDPSLPPLLLLGHLDTVPVEPVALASWTWPPYSGAVADGFVWGRGALDDKGSVVAQLEAVEVLVGSGFRPRRTVMLAYGHDEEIGGSRGAGEIAALLAARGVRASLALDEGMIIADGIVPGVAAPVALIGVSEKGSIHVELTAEGAPGHSSMPPGHTAVGRVAAAVARLEAAPMSAALDGPAAMLFDAVGPEMGMGQRLVFANRWLFSPLVVRKLASNPRTNALVRTTMAATVFHGGDKANVLPASASAVVNFRIHPRDDVESVLAHARAAIGDPEVRLEVNTDDISSEPSPVTDPEGPGFRLVERVIRGVMPEVLVAPSLTVGVTDARHYVEVADELLRFQPVALTSEDTSRLHGNDERISVEGLALEVRFYAALLRAGAE